MKDEAMEAVAQLTNLQFLNLEHSGQQSTDLQQSPFAVETLICNVPRKDCSCFVLCGAWVLGSCRAGVFLEHFEVACLLCNTQGVVVTMRQLTKWETTGDNIAKMWILACIGTFTNMQHIICYVCAFAETGVHLLRLSSLVFGKVFGSYNDKLALLNSKLEQDDNLAP